MIENDSSKCSWVPKDLVGCRRVKYDKTACLESSSCNDTLSYWMTDVNKCTKKFENEDLMIQKLNTAYPELSSD